MSGSFGGSGADLSADSPVDSPAAGGEGRRAAVEGLEGAALVPLLDDKREKIRALAAVNLGKLKDAAFLPCLARAAQCDVSTAVRREAAAAIGRLRCGEAAGVLVALTEDDDPKVVVQALRGLLALPIKSAEADAAMARLRAHPNEMVRDVLRRPRTGGGDDSRARRLQLESPDFMKNVVVHGDALETLKCVPAQSLHLTFTSPPYYNARDYSLYESYEAYLRFLETVFLEVHRATKTGRFFVLNTSPVIVPRVSRQHASRRYPIPFDIHPYLMKMGWEFVDDIVWVKPEASVKNRNGGFFQHRKPLAYKPNACTEYLMVYRKKTDRLLDWNIRQYSARQVGRSRVGDGYESTNVWRVDPAVDKTHSAVFPASLCSRVIRYYSMAEDLVCDPFGGSGTLGETAARLGRFFFMTERSDVYVARMRERFGQAGQLFARSPRVVDLPRFCSMGGGEEGRDGR